MSKVFLEVWQLDKDITVVILDKDGNGYRISGSELLGNRKRLIRVELNKRDKQEIMDIIKPKKDIKFIINHPGSGVPKTFNTFKEAMGLFEGFNVPRKVVNGVEEGFKKACNRVHRYYKK
jgi:hypothetical protein